MQPPGKRRKPGLRSASSCTRSARRPFGRFFQVSAGISDTMSRSTWPGPSSRTRKRPRVVVTGGVIVAVTAPHSAGTVGDRRFPERLHPRVLDADRQAGRRRDPPRQHRDDVPLPGLDADPAEAVVGDAVAAGARRQPQVVRVRGGRRPIGPDRELALRIGRGRLLPAHERLRELEGPVLDPLRIEAAVGGEVDVLEEDAVHRRGDRRARLVGRDRDLRHRDRRRLRARRARSDRQEPQRDRESVSLHAYLQQSVVNRHYTARNANGGEISVNVHVIDDISRDRADHGGELEAVAGARADQDHGVVPGVAIDQEMAVRRVGVGAHRRADGLGAQPGQVARDVGADRRGVGGRRRLERVDRPDHAAMVAGELDAVLEVAAQPAHRRQRVEQVLGRSPR